MREEPKCPQCGGGLLAVSYPEGETALNRDQWESTIAGNWYCEKCPSNDRGNAGYCYWWDREITQLTPPKVRIDPKDAELAALRAQLTEAKSEEITLAIYTTDDGHLTDVVERDEDGDPVDRKINATVIIAHVEMLVGKLAAAQAEIERLRRENEATAEKADDAERYEACIEEHLPKYVADDGTGDELGYEETIEAAGEEIKSLGKQLAAAQAELEVLRERLSMVQSLANYSEEAICQIPDLGADEDYQVAVRRVVQELDGTKAEVERLRKGCQRISEDYTPCDNSQVELALSEMRSAIGGLAESVAVRSDDEGRVGRKQVELFLPALERFIKTGRLHPKVGGFE